MKRILLLCTTACTFLCLQAQQFSVSYTAAAFKGPFSGKVLLYMNKNSKNPKDAMVGIESFPCMSVEVKNIKPGSAVLLDDKALSFPVKLSELERGEYNVQVVWDRNLGGRAIAESPGNMFSKPEKVVLTKEYTKTYRVICTEVVPEPVFHETTFIREMKVPSALLSSFHKKEMTINAAVALPAEYYTDSTRKFPVLYLVFGYGGDYHRFSGDTISRGRLLDSIPFITVYLDGNCALGHSVYANSDNNGPWGDALVKELIPAVESRFRTDGARLLTGHSSGGWTVLWLQTQYPSVFTATWSSSPDPVDFRDFQQVNLYENENMYYTKDSSLRSVATVAGFFPWATMRLAYRQEQVVYRGEQMHSFDAVFGPRGADGNPVTICDPVTGKINPAAFEHWKKYDICANLRHNWGTLQPLLEGKIRVTVGEQDNFLLQGAVHKLDKEMQALQAKMVFEYFPGDHFTVATKDFFSKGYKFLADKYREWQNKNKKGF